MEALRSSLEQVKTYLGEHIAPTHSELYARALQVFKSTDPGTVSTPKDSEPVLHPVRRVAHFVKPKEAKPKSRWSEDRRPDIFLLARLEGGARLNMGTMALLKLAATVALKREDCSLTARVIHYYIDEWELGEALALYERASSLWNGDAVHASAQKCIAEATRLRLEKAKTDEISKLYLQAIEIYRKNTKREEYIDAYNGLQQQCREQNLLAVETLEDHKESEKRP